MCMRYKTQIRFRDFHPEVSYRQKSFLTSQTLPIRSIATSKSRFAQKSQPVVNAAVKPD